MKSYDQLAQSAHAAFGKRLEAERPTYDRSQWEELSEAEKNAWAAAVQQLWAEFAAMR